MSFQAMAWAAKQRPSGGPTSKLLLLMLANYADSNGRCFPSASRLADDCGVTRSTVMDHLNRLELDALLSREARDGGPAGKRSNIYTLPCGERDAGDDVGTFRKGRKPDMGMSDIQTGGDVRLPDMGSPKNTATHVQIPDIEPIKEPIKEPITTGGAPVLSLQRVKPLPAMAKPNGAAVIHRLGVVMEEIASGARARVTAEQARKIAAGIVFAYWMHKFSHPNALLDPKRERVIVARLEENGGDVSELLYALDGARNDDWVMGTAPNARHANDSIDYVLRDRSKVETFANTRPKYRQGKPHDLAAKYAAVIRGDDVEEPPAGAAGESRTTHDAGGSHEQQQQHEQGQEMGTRNAAGAGPY